MFRGHTGPKGIRQPIRRGGHASSTMARSAAAAAGTRTPWRRAASALFARASAATTSRDARTRGACGSAGSLVGLPASPLRDLILENIEIEARNSFTIRHVTGLRFHNVKVNGQLVEAPPEGALPASAGR